IGTYTSQTDPAIFVYTLDTSTGKLTHRNSTAGIDNPSFLTISKDRQRLYAVSETAQFQGKAGGSGAAFAIQTPSGELTLLNRQSTRGEGPCHVTLDHSQRYLVVSNYAGGSICLYPLQANGEISELADMVQHHGSSHVFPNRQEKAHTHSATFDPSGE